MKRSGMKRTSGLKSDPEKVRAWQQRSRVRLGRTSVHSLSTTTKPTWKAGEDRKPRKPLKRSPLKKRNEKRIAKKHKAYAAVLRSAFHRKLRYLAWERAKGLCECERCVALRGDATARLAFRVGAVPDPLQVVERFNEATGWVQSVEEAFTPIPVWFVQKGGEAWQRFRSTDGQLHHDSYKLYSKEDDAELQLVRFVWKSCHARIEAEHGTRRRYLQQGAT